MYEQYNIFNDGVNVLSRGYYGPSHSTPLRMSPAHYITESWCNIAPIIGPLVQGREIWSLTLVGAGGVGIVAGPGGGLLMTTGNAPADSTEIDQGNDSYSIDNYPFCGFRVEPDLLGNKLIELGFSSIAGPGTNEMFMVQDTTLGSPLNWHLRTVDNVGGTTNQDTGVVVAGVQVVALWVPPELLGAEVFCSVDWVFAGSNVTNLPVPGSIQTVDHCLTTLNNANKTLTIYDTWAYQRMV